MFPQFNLLCPSTLKIGLNRVGYANVCDVFGAFLADFIETLDVMDNDEYLFGAGTVCSPCSFVVVVSVRKEIHFEINRKYTNDLWIILKSEHYH